MSERELHELLSGIAGADEAVRSRARDVWGSVAMPRGGLGLLEDAVVRIAALTGDVRIACAPRSVIVACADNGVVCQGVSQSGSEVTAMVARNLAQGRTPMCRMAATATCAVVPVDVGIRDFPGVPGVLDRRCANGTGDISVGPAMSRDVALEAMSVGISLVAERKHAGDRLIATGEMGIGNTTTSAAVCCALLGVPPRRACGRGAGLSDDGLARKVAVVERALAVNDWDREDAVGVIAALGGLDIAALVGVFLGGAIHRVPIVADGLISTVAALCACRLCPRALSAVVPSHRSSEPMAARLLQELGLEAPITAGMHVGEGTGAVAMLPLLDMAVAVFRGASSFDELGLEPYRDFGSSSC